VNNGRIVAAASTKGLQKRFGDVTQKNPAPEHHQLLWVLQQEGLRGF